MAYARKLLELAILFGALLLADHYQLFGSPFVELEPNPYWIPVLAMALAYGTGMGLVATAIASAIWFVSPHHWPRGFDSLAIQFHLSKLPLLWAVSAVAIGELTTMRRSRLEKLQENYDQLSIDLDKISTALSRVRKINRKLQVRIAVGQNVAEEAISAASGLLLSQRPSQTEALGKLIALAVQTEDFTYCRVQEGRLSPLLWGGSPNQPPRDMSQFHWSEAVLPGNVVLHNRQQQCPRLLDGLGIAAIRVKDPASGSTGAVLIIHSSEQLRFNPTTISEFHQLAEALSCYMEVFAKPTLRLAAPDHALEDKVA